jgi:pimeloyl-ACP methyl ester carboxylesterase
MNAPMADDISIYDRLWRSDAETCALLAQGAARRELIAVFGVTEYALLATLARQAQAARRRSAESVYLLPGIMGSQLGTLRSAGEPPGLLWLDPQDVIGGALSRLKMPDIAGLSTLGAIPYSYLALQLRLRAAGFAVTVHDYDWRMNLDDLAEAFAARLRQDAAPGIYIIAHSMGGLIARRAMQSADLGRVRRLVTLGTPHGGSYGAVQAIRGTYPVVRRLAALDRAHDADFLASQVFSTFPSLYQMVPRAGGGCSADLFDASRWPQSGPRPDPRLLDAGRAFTTDLSADEPRCVAICGTLQRTVTGLRLERDEFLYQVSDAGDGTVPLASAQLAGSHNYFVRCEHSALPRSATVARAVLELLRQGRTTRLASIASTRNAREVSVSDAQLRTTWNEKIDWTAMTPEERRRYLNQLNQPPPQYAAMGPALV